MQTTSNECMASVLHGNPLGNDLAECLVYPPSLAIPEECVNVEDVAELLNRRRCTIYYTDVAIKPLQQCGRKQNNHKPQA